MLRSLSHDTKKCDTLVHTSFFQPPIRWKQLGNWPNTYAKRLHKLANRMLVKRLVDETTVDRSPYPNFPWVPHSPGGIWSPRHQRNRLQPLFRTLIHERKFLNRYYILYFKEMTGGCETFLPVFLSLKSCQRLHSLNLYIYLYYSLHYQEHKTFDPGIVN